MRTFAAAAILLASCWPIETGGCDEVDPGYCTEYHGPPKQIAAVKAACLERGDAWADAGCPEDDRLGGCRVIDDKKNLSITTWFYSPIIESNISTASAESLAAWADLCRGP